MTATFVTHARTLTELRDEFVSDLHRRLAVLDVLTRHEKIATKAAALARAKMEIEDALTYWSKVELRGSKRTREETTS